MVHLAISVIHDLARGMRGRHNARLCRPGHPRRDTGVWPSRGRGRSRWGCPRLSVEQDFGQHHPDLGGNNTSKDKKGRKTTETQYGGGTQTVKNCLYTFVAAWSPERQSWIVTGFQQPSVRCALGGLS